MASIWGNTGDSGGVWTSTQVTGSVWCPTSGSRNLTWNCQVDFDAEEDTTDNYYYFADIQYSTNNSSWTAIQTHQLMTEDTSVHTTTSRRWYLSNHSVTNGCPGTGNYYYRVCIGRAQSSGATLDVDCCYGYTGSVKLYWTAVTNSTSPTSIMINGSTSNATINAEESFQVSWSGGTKGTNWSSWHVNVTGTGGPWDYYVTSGENMYDDFSFIRVGNTYTYRVEAVDGSTGRGYNKTITVTVRAKPITITLDPDGGSVSSTTFSTSHGTQITNLPTPTKAGFAFKGWYLDLNKTSVLLGVSNGTNFKPTGNKVSIGFQTYMSSYACSGDSSQPYQWLYPNGNSYGTRIGILGSTSTMRARIQRGTSETAGIYEDCDFSTTSLTAGWHYWNVIYDGNSSTKTVKIYVDGTLKTTKTLSGSYWNIFWVQNQPFYIGSPWFTGYIGNVTIYQDTTVRTEANTKNSFIAPRHDITLKARWERTGYVLTVNPNGGSYGGSTSNTNVTVTYGSQTVLSTPTRAGYDFVGWAAINGTINANYSAATGFFTAVPTKYGWSGQTTNHTLALATMDTASGFPNTIKMLTITEPGTSDRAVGWCKTSSLATSSNILIVFVAKAPVSTYFYVHNNATYQGSGYTWEYLTPMAGTGKWQTYAIKAKTGASITTNATGYYVLCGNNTTISTTTCPGNVTYNVAYAAIGLYDNIFNHDTNYVPNTSATSDTVYAIWVEKKYTLSYTLNGGSLASGTDTVRTSGSYKEALNPLSALWNRSPYAMGTGSALGSGKPTANSPGYWFYVERPTKAASVSSSTSTYTTTFNATANGGASNSTKTNTKTVTTSTPQNFYSWTITGMDNSSHHYWGRASSAVTTNSNQSFTSTSITLTAAHQTGGVPVEFYSLRQTPGTVTFTAGWTPGTATTTTTTTSITFPAIPSKANTTATTTRTVNYNANGGNSTPSAQSVSPTATVTWAANKWWTTQTSGGTSYTAGSTITPTASATYYARYTGTTGSYNSPTISLAAAIGFPAVTTTTTTTATLNFSAASAVTAKTTTKTVVSTQAKTFDKWRLGSASGTSYAASATFTPTTGSTTFYATSKNNGSASNVTTYGQVTLPNVPAKANTTSTITRTVSYNKNNGVSAPASQTVSPTATVTWTDDDKWYTTESGGTGYSQGTAYTLTADNGTLYAHYTGTTGTYNSPTLALAAAITRNVGHTTATITFNLNGSTDTVDPIYTTRNNTYAFKAWAEGSASGVTYAAGSTYTPTLAATTMYATWTVSYTYTAINLPNAPTRADDTNTATVTFNANGGSSSTSNSTYTVTTSYTFDKWRKGSTTGTSYSAGASFKPTSVNTTMYATWTGSTNIPSVATPVPTKKGYYCSGWYTAETGGTLRATAGESYTPPASGETIYAQWWKCCYVYKTSDSKWHKAIPYVYKSSTWKRAEPYVYKSSWK